MQSLRKSLRRRRNVQSKQDQIIKALTGDVWGIENPGAASDSEAAAYLEHYKEAARRTANVGPAQGRLINGPDQIVGLLQLLRVVKLNSHKPLQDITASIAAEKFAWLRDGQSNSGAAEATRVVVSIWLFVHISHTDASLTLPEAIAQSLSAAVPGSQGRLPFDFSAKSLTRKGGFTFRWTSDLSQHLHLASRSEIYFFRHSRVLEYLARGEHADLYPPSFLDEARRTFRLFFPTEAVKDARRTHKIEARHHVDLEAQVRLQDRLNLSKYPHFGRRLAAIGEQYDGTRPTQLRQWWYDRRNRVEWATLLVAVTVFVLTLCFGIVSSVTGIMQVYASFRWH